MLGTKSYSTMYSPTEGLKLHIRRSSCLIKRLINCEMFGRARGCVSSEDPDVDFLSLSVGKNISARNNLKPLLTRDECVKNWRGIHEVRFFFSFFSFFLECPEAIEFCLLAVNTQHDMKKRMAHSSCIPKMLALGKMGCFNIDNTISTPPPLSSNTEICRVFSSSFHFLSPLSSLFSHLIYFSPLSMYAVRSPDILTGFPAAKCP